MRIENFIYFFTICGFFIGLIFSIVNFNDPLYILFYTFLIMLFFYLLIHLSIAGFMDIKTISKNIFDKNKYEEVSDYFIYELENREKKINSLVDVIQYFDAKRESRVKTDESHGKIAA